MFNGDRVILKKTGVFGLVRVSFIPDIIFTIGSKTKYNPGFGIHL